MKGLSISPTTTVLSSLTIVGILLGVNTHNTPISRLEAVQGDREEHT